MSFTTLQTCEPVDLLLVKSWPKWDGNGAGTFCHVILDTVHYNKSPDIFLL